MLTHNDISSCFTTRLTIFLSWNTKRIKPSEFEKTPILETPSIDKLDVLLKISPRCVFTWHVLVYVVTTETNFNIFFLLKNILR